MNAQASVEDTPRTPDLLPSLLGRTRSRGRARSWAPLSGSGDGELADAPSPACSRRGSLRLARFIALAVAALLFLALPQAASASLSWSGPIALDGTNALTGVACPSTSQCTAVDDAGEQVTFDPASPGTPTPTTIDQPDLDGYGDLIGVACPSTSQCTAVDEFGNEVTFDPASPGTPTPTWLGIVGGNDDFASGVACPSTSQCTVVDADGEQGTFDPASLGTATWTPIDGNTYYASNGVACPSTSQCTAVGSDGSAQQVTFDPASPGTPTPTTIDSTNNSLVWVACPSTSQCTAVDDGGGQVTFDPASPETQTPTTIGSGYGSVLGAVACPSTSQCTAVGGAGQQVTFDPASPETPTPTTIDNTGLTGVACPSASLCVAVDNDGKAFVDQGSGVAPPANTSPPTVPPANTSHPTTCGGTSSSAAFTALAIARSDTQCSTELADESVFAESAAEHAGYLCHSPPGTNAITGVTPVVDEVSRIAWICHMSGWIATSDYNAWAEGRDRGLPGPQIRQALAKAHPPDPSFGVVFRPKPFAVPALGRTCPSLRGASCRRLRVAELGYLRALADVASLSEAVGVTANRFGGAKDAGDMHAESLQSVAEAKYLPLQANAVGELRRAGRRFGTALERDRINTVLTAKQVAQGRKQLRRLDGIPRSLVTSLERDGLITSRKDLERIIASLLKKAPRARATTLAQVLEM